jgi:hypothetical protein
MQNILIYKSVADFGLLEQRYKAVTFTKNLKADYVSSEVVLTAAK